jgi:glyceraldehyde-3-phosphate dehydrogenase (NADP+)
VSARSFLVGGRPRRSGRAVEVLDPYRDQPIAEVERPAAQDIEAALEAARSGFEAIRAAPAWRRAEWLEQVARRLSERRESFARTIALEAGKPIGLARAEVERAVLTFRTAASEALRIEGSCLPLDVAPGMEGRFAIARRFPVGPVSCITPFNFPLNLVAHKVAPALAAGCSVVLKPASKTPLSALDLGELLVEAGVPPEAVSVLPVEGKDSAGLVEDERIRAISFTGSAAVGWELRRRAWKKKVLLELGGNAASIVDRSADLDRAAERIAWGAFAFAGQSCISVQRVYVHEAVFEPFLEKLLDRTASLVVGDPMAEATVVGPVIRREDADRIERWVAEAIEGGAKLRLGGRRQGNLIWPVVLTGTEPRMKVSDEEVFGPVAIVEPAATLEAALEAADRSRFGLQAGIFTADLEAAFRAFERIEVGAVLLNEVPTWRADPMPYGGVKESGMGREGPRYAIEEYTERRLLVVCR